jgi:hypothetical protein
MRARIGVPVATTASFVAILLLISLVHVEASPGPFSVSPSSFTVKDAPPLGEAYRLERKLVIRNEDNVMRTFVLSVRQPLEGELENGFDPIPNEEWMFLRPAVIDIEENSSDTVEMFLKIPRWENLTGQRWEARISVERQRKPDELVALTYEVKAFIETTEELPPPPSRLPLPLTTIVILVVGVGGVAFLLGALARRLKGVKRRALW